MSIDNRREALKLLLEVDTGVDPQEVKGDRSKSVLFEACKLSKKLQSLEMAGEKWKMINHVWMEMLCYGASHCAWTQHGRQLGRGGELLTHVCLLMSHLGITEQIQILRDPDACDAAAVEAADKIARAAERAARRATERAEEVYADAGSREEADARAADARAKAHAARVHANAIKARAKATGAI